jgi:hypothetical protein
MRVPACDAEPDTNPRKPLGGLAADMVEDVHRGPEALMKALAQREDERDA